MRLLVLAFMLFFGVEGYSYDLFSCSLDSKKIGAVGVSLNLEAKSKLIFKDKSGKLRSCDLKLFNIEDKPRSVSPYMKINLNDINCRKKYGLNLFEDIQVTITSYSKNKYSALFKWLRTAQPQECKIKSIKMSELKLNERKFKKGLWGRK